MDLRRSGRHIMNNKLFCGDNLAIMRSMEDESVDLIYLDPPYYTKRDFKSFDDRWKSLDTYLEFMSLRINECHRLLKETGTFYLHCDRNAVHYLKVKIDKIFGYNNFRNQIG